MTEYCSETFEARTFDAMQPGTVSLGVPLHEGAVQVGAKDATERGRLRVTKAGNRLTIAREGGERLQADIMRRVDDPAGSARTIIRIPVFSEPVASVEFRHKTDLKGRLGWLACIENAQMLDADAVVTFARTVGSYALLKQSA